ncbi:hypothetical protein FKW77_006054 [Venturia effusa]|uniref:Uncharacterized protein n=1 Tax=Venturia effusa TaxID=50376 RepID=A0A517LKB0_9PEZI|nr:hypothetical protein FKW77_006054 [Venturia effusa]
MALTGFRIQANSAFQRQQFHSDAELEFDVVTVQRSSPSLTTSSLTKISAREFEPWIQHSTSSQCERALRLVRIDRDNNEILNCSRENFLACFGAFRLETSFLYLIQQVSSGLYHVRSTAADNPARIADVFYVSTLSYSLMWSFDPLWPSASAIFIPRHGNSLWASSQQTFDRFVDQLEYHKDLVDSAYFLLFVATVDTLQWMHKFLEIELYDIRHIEAITGHSSWTSADRQLPDPETLNEMSQSSGRCLSGLFIVSRHLSIVNRMLDSMRNGLEPNVSSYNFNSSKQQATADQSILEGLEILQCQLDNADDLNTYLQNRAKNQISVIFNLLAREDAHQSHEVARAAKEDSSAMKTIAVMTMVFLPGTFFAALFAMPSVPELVSSHFWVYWVFSVPCTILVFVVWLLIMMRVAIVDSLRKLIARGSGSKGEDD